jgi:hypothetical protein
LIEKMATTVHLQSRGCIALMRRGAAGSLLGSLGWRLEEK